MTQNEKDILFKDLCARLPYGIKGNFLNSDGSLSHDTLLRKVSITYSCLVTADGNDGMGLNGDVKPYLFPLSSMTEEQKQEYRKVCELDTEILEKHPMDGSPFPAMYNSQDWLDAHHFDYRGLIPMGLAIDATDLNIY